MRALYLIPMMVFLLLSGCQNTVKGFGEDMQKNGNEIQKSVDSK